MKELLSFDRYDMELAELSYCRIDAECDELEIRINCTVQTSFFWVQPQNCEVTIRFSGIDRIGGDLSKKIQTDYW